MPTKCIKCNSENVEKGRFRSIEDCHFKLNNTKFFTLKMPKIPVSAYMCLECGNIELIGNIERAKSLLKD